MLAPINTSFSDQTLVTCLFKTLSKLFLNNQRYALNLDLILALRQYGTLPYQLCNFTYEIIK